MNLWIFTGNLGGDAETRYTKDGTCVCDFSVAVAKGYGEKQKTTWVRCSLWGDMGERLAEHLKKGTKVSVAGETWLEEWEGKDGDKRMTLRADVVRITLLGKPRSADD